ncbi:ABC transporter substrate-binding protein [Pseudomonas sp. MH9.2]|uniref:ABC transporter substrate-binding protein n=1 Tax=unclassified Pseudomonas TaxID=196821 RepID=UPI002AC97B00|nr:MULTISPECIES: ABC transporter substrate-binding protein [unclassified Pseudomonas]MEB0006123.1 ABC transporter substrate-binding protein [Pseudomonas sp. RTB2]MEB0019648.1 ABC transporter substrate-binding protein [Pseudomonas sp. RTB3]MEB0025196.1 ABC transporter substrate-binding protein [Pseudomonas sp. MH9.2]MEB0147079.1 ABC transporter substrate-binding protein [Pseudomonas sp. CCC2.2]MEB0268421.1 ABC transporter substrate-binding protein [Pseudomonas sp. 5B4]
MRQRVRYGLIYLLTLAAATLLAPQSHAANEEMKVQIGYLAFIPDLGPVLSNIIPEPRDAGLRGAELAIIDSNSTGRFLNHSYTLQTANADSPQALLDAAQALHQQGLRLFVVNAPAETLRQLSAALPDSLLFNAGSADDSLRSTACLNNVLHTLPSRAMLTDALAQFLTVRRWNRWLLIVGQTPDDQAYAAALRRAAKRFGHTIVAEKAWSFDNDQRRSAQADMPLFTQTTEYDVVLVADERGDFGEYVPYQTWYPRPVAGTQGLTPVGWHKSVETYGAAQLQKRFEALAGRWMNDRDFAAWMAVRSIASAVNKLHQTDPMVIRQAELSDQLPLDGFKGRKLSYRAWNGQLRQPIPIVQPRALVSTSPQDGFLHPVTELDTLGYDKPEVTCHFQ